MTFNVNGVMKDVSKSVKDISADEFRMIAFRAFRNIVIGTPVDKGTARASWNVSVAQADMTAQPPSRNRTLTLAEMPKNMLLRPFYLSSPIPYMYRLEHGWSAQNAGFIRAGLMSEGLL